MMRRGRVMKSVVAGVGLCAALVFATPPVFAQATRFDSIDWTRVMRALGNALNSWRLSPFPRRTPTPIRPRTATVAPPQSTPTRTVPPPTSTRTLPPATRTRTATRTGTSTRTRTITRTPSLTPSPRPTSTPVPTTSNNGQIAFGEAEGIPPAQKLASAFVVFPYLVTRPPFDTRIELMNMSNREIGLQCFYVRESDCLEIGFFVSLTANQPLSWSAFDGVSNTLTRTRVPPLDTYGSFAELKCAVDTDLPELSAQNVLQGRAIVVDQTNGETVGYGAVGFQRLSPGGYNGVVDLDGFTYESCPERLHFQVLTVGSGGPSSSLITVPCAQDLLTQTPTETVVQMQIVNEFEQVFSSSYRFKCLSSQSLGKFITLTKSVAGGSSAHLIIRGVSTPLIGLAIDRFSGQNDTLHTTANEPFLEGGRPATVIFP
jgi:hypothetical protein